MTPMDNQSVTWTHFAEPNQIPTCVYLWYVYACACGCDLPWAYDQELSTNNYSVRESFCLSILDEFVGAVEHHAQHCTWLWPPSKLPAFIRQDHLPKDLPGEPWIQKASRSWIYPSHTFNTFNNTDYNTYLSHRVSFHVTNAKMIMTLKSKILHDY